MFGSLMMFASGFSVSWPRSARSSEPFCSGGSTSANAAMMRPASEMSRVSTATPDECVKALTIGSSE